LGIVKSLNRSILDFVEMIIRNERRFPMKKTRAALLTLLQCVIISVTVSSLAMGGVIPKDDVGDPPISIYVDSKTVGSSQQRIIYWTSNPDSWWWNGKSSTPLKVSILLIPDPRMYDTNSNFYRLMENDDIYLYTQLQQFELWGSQACRDECIRDLEKCKKIFERQAEQVCCYFGHLGCMFACLFKSPTFDLASFDTSTSGSITFTFPTSDQTSKETRNCAFAIYLADAATDDLETAANSIVIYSNPFPLSFDAGLNVIKNNGGPSGSAFFPGGNR